MLLWVEEGHHEEVAMAESPSPVPTTAAGVVTKPSSSSVPRSVRRIEELVKARGMKVFAVIDHSGEAARVGLEMPPAQVVIFGNPAAGTPVMVRAPLVGLDLPLKVLVWEDSQGQVWLSYTDPAYLGARYSLPDHLGARLAGIEGLVAEAARP